jgi:hypothetical protein
MNNKSCVYYTYPLEMLANTDIDQDLHSPGRFVPDAEPADDDGGHHPFMLSQHSERRHRPRPYFQC